jgi:hypothetical protein
VVEEEADSLDKGVAGIGIAGRGIVGIVQVVPVVVVIVVGDVVVEDTLRVLDIVADADADADVTRVNVPPVVVGATMAVVRPVVQERVGMEAHREPEGRKGRVVELGRRGD